MLEKFVFVWIDVVKGVALRGLGESGDRYVLKVCVGAKDFGRLQMGH